jgi:hypothetical protein
MKSVMKRLINLGFSLELTEEAKTFLADKGYDQQFGARPLHRAIQKYLIVKCFPLENSQWMQRICLLLPQDFWKILDVSLVNLQCKK